VFLDPIRTGETRRGDRDHGHATPQPTITPGP
jgi:hypothetical protein